MRRFANGWVFALLVLATFAAYAPALGGGFIWDDDAHVTRPELRTADGLGRIWLQVGATQQYYPILHSAFWLEHRLWGDSPMPYHAVNVALHALAACLFAVALRRMALPGAWLAAFVFAVHPVEVESVAWISEQKNTLSLVFYLASALAYLAFEERRRPWTYAGAFGLFVLALLTKSVTATLPAALLVLAWFRKGSLSWKRDGLPLVPWLAVGASAGLFTSWIERRFIGAQGSGFALTLAQRFLVAGRAIAFYLGKLAWPSHLAFIYPRVVPDPRNPADWLPLACSLALAAAAWRMLRFSRAPLAAYLLFVGSLFPALGFVNVYPFLFSFVADHFQYLAGLGMIALAAGCADRLAARARFGSGRPATIAGAALVALLGALTWRQCGIYKNGETLYAATLERNPGCWLAHLNLGNEILERGDVPEAIVHYRTAERIEPDYPSTHFNLAKALMQEGRAAEAIPEFEQVLRLQPGDAEARNNVGIALAGLGRAGEAEAQFAEAIRARPGYAKALANYGILLAGQGRLAEAVSLDERALRADPALIATRCNLAQVLVRMGRIDEARLQLAAALRARPDDPEAQALLDRIDSAEGGRRP